MNQKRFIIGKVDAKDQSAYDFCQRISKWESVFEVLLQDSSRKKSSFGYWKISLLKDDSILNDDNDHFYSWDE